MTVPIAFEEAVYPWELMGSQYPLVRPDLAPGTAEWIHDEEGVTTQLAFICPCGCTRVRMVSVYIGEVGQGWMWNNDRDLPSLLPSLRFADCSWHGHLTVGEFHPVL